MTTPTIPQGNKYMDATLWTGTNSTGTLTVSNLQFKPDLIWSKARNQAFSNQITDSVRGVNKTVASNSTAAEDTTNVSGAISAFNSNGFTATAGSSDNWYWNYNGGTFVGWCWQAGGTAVSNTSGSITSSVSANTTSGFSVVTFTSQASSTGTVGHGLGVVPQFIIVKTRAVVGNWTVYHVSTGNTGYTQLSSANAYAANTGTWNNTSPTSSVFTLGTDWAASYSCVAYCWTPIAGYSQFGSYTGNGSTDGPFVYLGFRPKFLLFKQSSAAGEYWHIMDTSRSPYNGVDLDLYPNLANAEATYSPPALDLLSNGFKLRTSNSAWNGSGATYIYAAFAENPFKYSNAR